MSALTSPFFQGSGEPGHLLSGAPGGPPQRDRCAAGASAPAARPRGAGVSSPSPAGDSPASCTPPHSCGSEHAWPRARSGLRSPHFSAYSSLFPKSGHLGRLCPPNPRAKGLKSLGRTPEIWSHGVVRAGRENVALNHVVHVSLSSTPTGGWGLPQCVPLFPQTYGQLAAWAPSGLPGDLAGTTAPWQPVERPALGVGPVCTLVLRLRQQRWG